MKVVGTQVYRLGDIELDPAQGCIKLGGQEHYLRQKAFQLLRYLVEHRDRLITKEELIDNIWQGTAVSDDALVQLVKEVRKVLGDDPRQPRFIKTLPKTGYRFIGPVEELRLDQRAAIETLEVTTVEFEYEEESADHNQPTNTIAQVLPAPLFKRRGRRRLTLIFIPIAILIVAAAVTVFISQRMRPAKPSLAEEPLPRVPGRKALAVMYFENRSESRDLDWLRVGLADMLITNLTRSKTLSVLGRRQVHLMLERIGHNQADTIQLNEALDIGQRSHAEVILLGSFARLGDSFRIDAQLHDARTGQLIAAEHLIVDKPEHVLAQIDLLSAKLAADLGAASEGHATRQGLTSVMTDNLEAYRYYSLALEKAQGLDNTAAVELLKKAIALDGEFAMAYARIGYSYAITSGHAAKAKPYLEKAFQLANRLSDKDKLHLTAWYAIANLDWADAIRTMREITANYSLEVEAYLQLGRLLHGEAQHEEAIEVLKRGLAVDPQAKDLHNTLGLVYSELGIHDEAIAAHRQYVALAPVLPNAHDSLGMSYQWAGRYEEAVNEYNRALALNPDFEVARVHLANTYYQQGRYQAAAEHFSRYIEIAPSDLERGVGCDSLSLIYWRKKDYRRAAQMAKTASRYISLPYWMQKMITADQGKLAVAEEMNQKWLGQQTYANRGRRDSLRGYHYLSGYIALKRGQTDQAIESLKEATRQRPQIWAADPKEDCLANAYLELGRLDEAVAEYERILKLNPNYPLAHYHLAQAYERQGQMEQARTEYEEFLRIWSNADPDIPEIILTRTRLNLLKPS